MDVAYHFGARIFPSDIRVKISFLPKPLTLTSQFARSHLLDDFEKLGQEDYWRLVDKQVDVLWHQDVRIDPGLKSGANLFQNCLHSLLGSQRIEMRETMKATECNEVERFCFLKSLETGRHDSILVRTPA
jgi:hypothetical protein